MREIEGDSLLKHEAEVGKGVSAMPGMSYFKGAEGEGAVKMAQSVKWSPHTMKTQVLIPSSHKSLRAGATKTGGSLGVLASQSNRTGKLEVQQEILS